MVLSKLSKLIVRKEMNQALKAIDYVYKIELIADSQVKKRNLSMTAALWSEIKKHVKKSKI